MKGKLWNCKGCRLGCTSVFKVNGCSLPFNEISDKEKEAGQCIYFVDAKFKYQPAVAG